MSDESDFRVWVGCLACYNNGGLVGQWYDAREAGEVTVAQVHDLKTDPPPTWHEELWVMDLDNAPKGYGHEMSPSAAQEIAEALDEIPSYVEADAYLAWLNYNGYDLVGHDYLSDFEDAYAGHYDSFRDYSDDLADELLACERPLLTQPGQRPEDLLMYRYFDYEAFARDLKYETTVFDAPGHTVYVFRD